MVVFYCCLLFYDVCLGIILWLLIFGVEASILLCQRLVFIYGYITIFFLSNVSIFKDQKRTKLES